MIIFIGWRDVWANSGRKSAGLHVFPDVRLDDRQFIEDGIRFGKGLQLVNILRDLPGGFEKWPLLFANATPG